MSTPTTTATPAPAAPNYPMPYRRTNTYAILSLVFAFLFWPLGIAFGHVARRQIAETGEDGHGLATAGLVISYVCLGFAALFLIVVIAAVGHAAAAIPAAGMVVVH